MSEFSRREGSTFKTGIPVYLPNPGEKSWTDVHGLATITDEGEINIKLEKEAALTLAKQFQQGILMQLSFDYRMPVASDLSIAVSASIPSRRVMRRLISLSGAILPVAIIARMAS